MDADFDRAVTVMRSAPAKINLALHITGRRADSYHELDTLAVFADCGERISVSPGNDLSLAVTGPFAAHGRVDGSNLVLAAAQKLQNATGTVAGAVIGLEKHLPAGAGLGGGSADAAATLNALNILWQAGLDVRKLAELGACLGADVPMCVYSRALRAGGIGEVIKPLSTVPPLPLVLVWPGKPLSTAAVFARLHNVSNTALPTLPDTFPTVEDMADYLANTRNDLQEVAIEAEPAIADALGALRETGKCLLSRMSGSGSACFGLYPSKAQADAAGRLIGVAHPGWWVRLVWAR